MRISRREFLKYCSVAAGALGLTATDLLKLEDALALPGGVQVIWLNGAACTGCTVSLANSAYYATIQDLILNPPAASSLDIKYSETLMAAAGDLATGAASAVTGGYVLALEGALQADNYCSVGSFPGAATENLHDVFAKFATATNCLAILGIGTCACYGGIPSGAPNPTSAQGIVDFLKANYSGSQLRGLRNKTVNIPGCPPNPNWIVGTIAYIIGNNLNLPSVDALRRPRAFYGERNCNNCSRFAASISNGGPQPANGFIKNPMDIGNPNMTSACLKYVGCKGSRTKSDCSSKKWHSPGPSQLGVNWCVGAGAPCQGCVQNYFPDRMKPFFAIR